MNVEFTEITSALVEWFAWPNTIPSDSPTHGILENGVHKTPRFGDVVVAPTDWTIYV